MRAIKDSTARTYRSLWRKFCGWCEGTGGLDSLPSDDHTLAEFIKDAQEDGATLQTQRLYIVAIKRAHAEAGHPSPAGLLTDIQLSKARAGGSRKTQPITLEQLRRIISWHPSSLKQARDSALIAITFAAALTRVEAQSLTRDQFEFTQQGVIYRPMPVVSVYRFSSLPCYIPTDSEIGEIAVSLLRTWLDIQSDVGPVFTKVDRFGQFHTKPLSRQALQDIVRRRFKMADLTSSSYTFGSLRMGLADTCATARVQRHVIRAHMRMRDDRPAGTTNEPERGFFNSPLHALKWPDSKPR